MDNLHNEDKTTGIFCTNYLFLIEGIGGMRRKWPILQEKVEMSANVKFETITTFAHLVQTMGTFWVNYPNIFSIDIPLEI